MRGHKLAQLDPLGLSSADLDAERPQDLTFKFYNFSKTDSITLLLARSLRTYIRSSTQSSFWNIS